MLAVGATGVRHYGPDGEARQDEVEVFIHSLVPPPRMYVFGTTDFAAAAGAIGKLLGYKLTVCDRATVKSLPGVGHSCGRVNQLLQLGSLLR